MQMAEVTGFEPAISALTGQRFKPLSYTSVRGLITLHPRLHAVKGFFSRIIFSVHPCQR